MKPLLLTAGVVMSASALLVPQTPGGNQSTLIDQRIVVDADVRISFDGNVPHMEAYVTASADAFDILLAGGALLLRIEA